MPCYESSLQYVHHLECINSRSEPGQPEVRVIEGTSGRDHGSSAPRETTIIHLVECCPTRISAVDRHYLIKNKPNTTGSALHYASNHVPVKSLYPSGAQTRTHLIGRAGFLRMKQLNINDINNM